MNTNEIRFYLHNYDNLKEEVKNLQDALDQYRRMDISGIKAQVITDMPICHSSTSKTELMALTRVEYTAGLMDELDHKMRLLLSINSIIFYIPEDQKEIIRWRYLEIPIGRAKYNWVEIGDRVHKSEERCKHIDCDIILKIQLKHLHGTKTTHKRHVADIPLDNVG